MQDTPAGQGPRIGAIILARIDSQRLPGKALADVEGRPLLWYILERFAADPSMPVVLATSDRSVDDPLVEAASKLELKVFRGSADDVAGRFAAAARANGLDAAFRVNGDSPFLDDSLLREARRLYLTGDADLVTNLRPRTYPYGVSVELVRIAALEASLEEADADDREHVTRTLYRLLPPDRIASIIDGSQPPDGPRTQIRLTIDDAADLAAFRAFVQSLRADWQNAGYREALASGLFGPQTLPV
jgi:spore coat polysaccharide biosynthesis protein SpsF